MTKAPRTIHAPIQIGDRFGLLTISGPVEMRPHPSGRMRPWWPLRCDCGAEYVVAADKIKSGEKRSCYGCQPRPGNRKERTQAERDAVGARSVTHGMTKTPEYATWHGMLDRCYNPNNVRWQHYGGRGIIVCPEWKTSFETFFADMGERPSPKHSIDRVDNNKNYEPGNCAWRTVTEQNRNRSNTTMFDTENGSVPLASLTGNAVVPHYVVQMRVNRLGWSLEKAITTPSQGRKRS